MQHVDLRRYLYGYYKVYTDYVLNFGVVVIATQSPRASVKFCLKNVQTNKQKQWTLLLMGETILALEANVRASVAVHIAKF